MKKQNLTVLAAVAAALLLSGCAGSKGAYSGDIQDDRVEKGSIVAPAPDTGATEPVQAAPAPAPAPVVADARETDDMLKKRIVYFDYDKSAVRSEAMPVLQAHAEFLSGNSATGVVLGGHADERGSNEYNLALGQRRADAVRDILVSWGASGGQIESLSFGEERPRAQGQNEAAWQQNRRVEIRYTDE